ncbi:ABC transporter substrate-binding protein [Candidatus Bipolaricaulota bacterium]|nr:ABC transporter substrate-binding protein [Candidatus Bipolaricaulota bacterium]
MKFRSKIVVIVVLSCMLVAMASSSSTSSNLDTVVSVAFGRVYTLDPAYASDSSSKAILLSVYEGLIRTALEDCDATLSYRYPDEFWACPPTKFEPVLATCVPTKRNGNISADGKTYYFPIQKDVYFHNVDKLTPEDVEYTYERALIEGDAEGESWMLINALFGEYSIDDLALEVTGHFIDDLVRRADSDDEARKDLRKVCEKIQEAIEVEGNVVVFHLYKPRADFLALLAQEGPSFNHIIDKKWAIQQGDWPGTCDEWWSWYEVEPSQSALYNKENGTGPFKVETWDPGQQITLVADDSYRGGKPRIGRFTRWEIDCPAQRTQMILQGTADIAEIPMDMLPQFEGRDEFAVLDKLPLMAMNPVVFFNTDIAKDRDFIGSGKLDGGGIPPEFFNDINVRKAFAYAFDYEGYSTGVLHIEGSSAAVGPIPRSLTYYYNPEQETYSWERQDAMEYLKKAWDGDLWETGFKFTIPYVKGNERQKAIAEIFQQNIQELNEKFLIEPKEVSWSEWLEYWSQNKMPLFISGWFADYPDPDNFVRPFMHSNGVYMGSQGRPLSDLAKELFDPLIEKALEVQDESERQAIYHRLQQLAHDYAIQIYLPQATAVRVVSANFRNLPWNPLLTEFWIYQDTYKEP